MVAFVAYGRLVAWNINLFLAATGTVPDTAILSALFVAAAVFAYCLLFVSHNR
jgi:hypothetical protein